MKVRVGFGLGTRGLDALETTFGPIVDALEALAFDSLWLSERITDSAPDPVVGMSYAAGRTHKLKFGMSVMVLPGRNPALVAKELATLDRLSNGRLLPAFGLGAPFAAEHRAFGVDPADRAELFDVALDRVRRYWAGDEIDGVRVRPIPVQNPLEVWLGGIGKKECARVGRVSDGWLPSFTTPEDASVRRRLVEDAAAEAGREIDAGHFGALVAYSHAPLAPEVKALIGRRRRDLDPDEVIPAGFEALRGRLEAFIERGFSKFVVVPIAEPGASPDAWRAELESLAAAVLPLQN